MGRVFVLLCLMAAAGLAGANSQRFCNAEAVPCVEYGAQVFQERCALCHGSDGMGEGLLALAIEGYPNTNLLERQHAVGEADLTKVIANGAGGNATNKEMPPFGDELTMTQIESVSAFVAYLRQDTASAVTLLHGAAESVQPSVRTGRGIFHGRCAICHGSEGKGDGKMSRIITTPPPFNLTLSRAGDDYLREIISKGGSGVGRSSKMPPWGGDLTVPEIESVIMYIKTLRSTH